MSSASHTGLLIGLAIAWFLEIRARRHAERQFWQLKTELLAKEMQLHYAEQRLETETKR